MDAYAASKGVAAAAFYASEGDELGLLVLGPLFTL